MISWLKRHFIPHPENDHRPHFLHSNNIRQIIGVVLFFELILFVLPTLNFVELIKHSNLSAVLPAVLAASTNAERVESDLNVLSSSELLNRAAQLKAEDMAAKGYFSHNSPDGKTPWYWIDKVGYPYEYAGENLAVNFTDSQDVTDAWMNSPTHRSNIVKANYSEMGTGVAVGQYKGAEAVFVVQLYANPKVVPSTPQKSSARLAVEEALETKVAIAAEEKQPVVAQVETQVTSVLGEETQPNNELTSPNREPSLLESTLASPRNTTTAVFYVVVGILALALLLNHFVRTGHRHPDLVTNGLFAIVFIFGIYLVNTYVVTASGFETSYTETVKEVVK